MNWTIEESAFDPDQIAAIGNKYMIGNGYLGYRGTLEEFTKRQLVACTLAGLYDKVGDGWREPVNAPNGLFTRLAVDGKALNILEHDGVRHRQSLHLRTGTFGRSTVFALDNGTEVRLDSERFASMNNLHQLIMRVAVTCSHAATVVVETGIDGDVWDINGPHLESFDHHEQNGILGLTAKTHEAGVTVAVAEGLKGDAGSEMNAIGGLSHLRRITIDCEAGRTYTFTKVVSVFTSHDVAGDPLAAAIACSEQALTEGYDLLHAKHQWHWEKRWAESGVTVKGDEEADLALNYSIYQLLIIAPSHSDRVSIPARGLSGQVYKGAVFWDTEMFMLPFFLYTKPELARNLAMYRVHTLDGARRKAAEYGFRGAFYAWESQDTGDDACTLFNITDVFTNRPMRTYFRDKQIHISADVAIGIWQYYSATGDESVLLDGGAEVILECARFFYAYAYYKTDKDRYELLDVTGPDEYHERVGNNAFTNYLVHRVLSIADRTAELLQSEHPEAYDQLVEKLDYRRDLDRIRSMQAALYLPEADEKSHLIEQFDGYFRLEDPSLEQLKARMLNQHEYLGGGNGIATTTQILKQADVVLMLHLFKDRFSQEVIRANWDYYEPRTEHGSSLSPCVYAMVAAHIGYTEWAYRYFLKTATIDLTGSSKQYVGTLYIGGTHPAANGGAWMAAIFGFAGFQVEDDTVVIRPALPQKWESLAFRFHVKGQQFAAVIDRTGIVVESGENNRKPQSFRLYDRFVVCLPGERVEACK